MTWMTSLAPTGLWAEVAQQPGDGRTSGTGQQTAYCSSSQGETFAAVQSGTTGHDDLRGQQGWTAENQPAAREDAGQKYPHAGVAMNLGRVDRVVPAQVCLVVIWGRLVR